jgi:hypothetical protein
MNNMKNVKKIIGVIASFIALTCIFGILGIPIEDSFIKGIYVGLFVDGMIVCMIILILLIHWTTKQFES